MIGRGGRNSWIKLAGCTIGLAVLLAGTSAPAQTAEPAPFPAASADSSPTAIYDSDVIQAGCSSCGGNSLLRPNLDGDFMGCCGDGHCNGHKPCYPCEGKTFIGRFECALYHCICCPDPCYEPRWLPVADAAFFTGSARPITQQRFRWDSGLNVRLADRAGYFFGQAGLFGPPLPLPRTPPFAPVNFRYNELSVYTEAAAKRVSLFIDYPYRSIENGEGINSAAGFGDLCIGTKTLLFDCELMQIAMQNKTWIPLGIPFKGLGAGHVSLEPSLLVELKLGADTYVQSQVSEWIPFGGGVVAGPILHYHLSLNQVVCKPLPDVPIIGTCEFSGWTFQDGSYSDPAGQVVNNQLVPSLIPASGYTYFYLGGGLRMVICDRLDFGFGAEFSLQHQHWADPLFRSEFRFRY